MKIKEFDDLYDDSDFFEKDNGKRAKEKECSLKRASERTEKRYNKYAQILGMNDNESEKVVVDDENCM